MTVKKITKLLGGEVVYIPKRPGEPNVTFADISKIQKHLKWRPKITILKGINKLLKEIHYWEEAPVWTPKKISKATKNWFKYLS